MYKLSCNLFHFIFNTASSNLIISLLYRYHFGWEKSRPWCLYLLCYNIFIMIKNIFYYLLAFMTLCYSVWHFLSIIFNTIEKKVPDILDNVYDYSDSYNNDTFRFSIASLVIMLPIYIAISWHINRQIEDGHIEADSKVRHTMIYTTILFSVIAIAGSLVSTVYSYLGGEITTRFVYKALSVSIVSLAVGAYYYYTLNRNYKIKSNKPIIIATSVLVIVFAICAYSVIVIGTPSEVRNKKLDQKSLGNLSQIESRLLATIYDPQSYNTNGTSPKLPVFTNTDKFPLTIDSENLFTYSNIDPNTNEHYPYRVISKDKNKIVYELCPTFASELKKGNRIPTPYDDNIYNNRDYTRTYDNNVFVSHGIGLVCYQTTFTQSTTTKNTSGIITPHE